MTPQTPQQGWPKGAAGQELQRLLLPGEQVLGWASGKGGGLLVATDQRALIIKVGVATTGRWNGQTVNAFPYAQITGVKFQTGNFDGSVTVSTAGVQERPLGRFAQMSADNICAFGRNDQKTFQWLVDILRQRIAAAQQPSAVTPAPALAAPNLASNIAAQIQQLAGLRDAGVLSSEEFERKKAELLARM